jgi:putative SbcD/Mre11-related phosphoesterase
MNKPFFEGAELIGLGLYLAPEKTLVVADLHLGYEAAQNKQGVLLPRVNAKEIKKDFQEIFKKTGKLKRVVIAGDLKHEFGNLEFTEWREVLDLLGFVRENCEEVVLTQGNHDKLLGPLNNWSKLTVLKEGLPLRNGEIFILHGHQIPEKNLYFKKAKVLVIAHDHPVIALKEESRKEKFKAFLKGKWKGKTVLVLPSMVKITQGTDMLRESTLSPFLENLDEFEAWLVEDKPYYFGKVGNLL